MSNQLPALAELHLAPAEAFKNDKFNLLLNQQPHNDWVKKHPMAKVKNDQGKDVPARYMPIDKIEYLLTRIFQEWKVEVLQSQIMFQSISVTVRLHYKNPVTGQWSFHDGCGAKSVQKDSGSEFNANTIKDAGIQMAFPAAKSYALKDAAQHLGAIFGKDLNRRDIVQFSGSYTPVAQENRQESHTPEEPTSTEPLTEDFPL